MLTADEIRVIESNGHSLFGASKSHRYLECAGSLLAEIGHPDPATYEAAEGTVAHYIAARWLTMDYELSDFEFEVGRTHEERGHEIEVTREMLAYLEQYANWCRELPGEHYYEQRVDYSRLTPIFGQGGTADHFAIRPHHLTITDLKYGTGVQIFAVWNSQAILYALGVIYEWDWLYDFDRITIRICQPRLGHFDVWETTKAELLAWAEIARQKMAATWTPYAPRTPGEKQCQFCRAQATCAAYVSKMDRLADDTFTATEVTSAVKRLGQPGYEITPPMVPPLTTAQLAHILKFRKPFESFFEKAYVELSRRVAAGDDPIPDGWMMGQGRSSRVVSDRKGVMRAMGRYGYDSFDLFTSEFLSPAALEGKLIEAHLKKAEATSVLKPFVTTIAGRPTLTLAAPGKTHAIDLADSTFEDEGL